LFVQQNFNITPSPEANYIIKMHNHAGRLR
jgi:hypothetical protein